MNKWIDFYAPFFENREKARQFVERFQKIRPDDMKHQARIMMLQARRLVSLAADLPQIRPGRESLQLLFLLICAENISKLHANFNGERQSRPYTRRFFEKLVTADDQAKLISGFMTHDIKLLTLRKIVDLLYDVRCDVVHEGNYWGFHFHDGKTPMLNTEPDVIVSMTIEEFRAIVIRGCINAIETYGGRSI